MRLSRFIVRLTSALLRSASLSDEDRSILTTILVDKLGAVPVRDILTLDESGTVLVGGKPVDFTQAKALRRSARRVQNEVSRRLIKEQIAFEAVKIGVHTGETTSQVIFSRAALWLQQEEDKLYRLLSQSGEDENEDDNDSP